MVIMTLTDLQCKRILSKLGFKYGVSPRLLAMRLLIDLDKDEMRVGVMEISALETHTSVWCGIGKPDVASGSIEPTEIVPLQLNTKEHDILN